MERVIKELPLTDLTSGVANVDRATRRRGRTPVRGTDLVIAATMAFTMGLLAGLMIWAALMGD